VCVVQIVVLGAGAIGSLYGAKLAPAHDVTLVGRPDHVAAINASGLEIVGVEPQVVKVRATTRLDRIAADTLILLTTKVSSTTSALEPIAALVRDDTTILCLQNGLGSEEVARRAIGARGVVLRGITQFGAIFRSPGVIDYKVKGYTLIEPGAGSEVIATLFADSGLDGRISGDIRIEIWRKLIFNCVINPITSMIGCEVGGIASPRLAALKQLVIDECLAVAAAEGVRFDIDFLRTIDEVFGPSRNIASMQQDLLKGHQTEIDYMNGAVAARGARHGIDAPVNRALTAIIKAMETQSPRADPRKPVSDVP
jgi:2-dehydropantoate 2-reductase